MDAFPCVKSPREFAGEGFEVIGNPSFPGERIEVWFQDGAFSGIQLPGMELGKPWTPETNHEWSKFQRRLEAERLALHLRDQPADREAQARLAGIRKICKTERPQDKATERAVSKILKGRNPSTWQMQNNRQRAAIIALMELCRELNKPPNGNELIDRMLTIRDDLDEMGFLLILSGERKNLVILLREIGLDWLEFRRRGYQGNR